METKATLDNIIEYNHVTYSWFLDIYSYYGVRIYEIRNSKYVDEKSELFNILF